MDQQPQQEQNTARTTQRGSRLENLWNRKKRHPWEEDVGEAPSSDDDVDDISKPEDAAAAMAKDGSAKSSVRRNRRSLGPAPLVSPRQLQKQKPTTTTPTNTSQKTGSRGRRGKSSDATTNERKKNKKKQKENTLPNVPPFEDDNENDNSKGFEKQPQAQPRQSPPPAPVPPADNRSYNNNNNNNNMYDASNADTDATSDMELLGIDFDQDGDALREALGEEVLAMWDAQGLYLDLPELRPAILQGVVEQKFQALVDEQRALREQVAADALFGGTSVAGPTANRAMATGDCAMSIIAEGSDEEDDDDDDDDSCDEEHDEPAHAVKHEMPTVTEEEGSLVSEQQQQQQQQPPPETQATEEDKDPNALNASVVLEELQVRLKEVDTEDQPYIEASGCLGQTEPSPVPIADQHAFSKLRLHDAIEKRVSQVFTGDHHVVLATSFDEEDDKPQGNASADAAKKNADTMDVSSKSLPALSCNSKSPKAELRERLSQSFSNFDALMGSKKIVSTTLADEDEWTECTASVAPDASRRGPASVSGGVVMSQETKVAQQRALSRGGDTYYEEYTVAEPSVVEEYTVREDSVVDVDALSEQREKQRREDQKSSATGDENESYLEYTVQDDNTPTRKTRPNTKKNSKAPDSLSSSLHLVDAVNEESPPDVVTPPQQPSKKSSLDDLGGASFPMINTTAMDDDGWDDMTQITFDQTMDGMNSTTQNHHHASAYLKNYGTAGQNRNNVTLSPPRKYHSGVDSEKTEPTRASTSAHDASEHNNHDKSSIASSADLSSQAAAALAKTVAKILRVDIWSPTASVVLSALEKLGQAAAIGSHQRSNIARLGGIIAILRAMQMHPTNVSIQLAACQALQNLAVDRETQIAIGDVGGIPTIATSMHSHMEEVEVQVAGSKVLATITYPRSTEEAEDADDDDMPTDGAVSALVASMMRHSKNTDIQAHAFGALANLCLDHRGRLQELSESGGLTTMTLALQRPWKNKMDQHEAISTLSILLRSLAELGSVDC